MKIYRALAYIIVVAGLLSIGYGTAFAKGATITVDTTADPGGAGVCSLRDAIKSANEGPGGPPSVGSTCAVGNGDDQIRFAIGTCGPGSISGTVCSIQLGAELLVFDTVDLNGAILPGNTAQRPGIELDGGGSAAGLVLIGGGASNSQVRGMIINNFDEGIVVDSSDHNTIAGNYFGTPDGISNEGSWVNGVLVFESNHTVIGGSNDTDRNIFLGVAVEDSTAIRFLNYGNRGDETTTSNNTVINNFIGLNILGESPPNVGFPGVVWDIAIIFDMRPILSSCLNCEMSGNRIMDNLVKHCFTGINYASHIPHSQPADPDPGKDIKIIRNVVSLSNDFAGGTGMLIGGPFRNMEISDNVLTNATVGMNLTIDSRGGVLEGPQDSVVYGNYIGVDHDGNPGPHSGIGVRVFSAFNLLISDNVVANAGTGIYLREPSQDTIPGKQTPESVSILANSVYDNEFLGIDLFETGNRVDGVTLNDGPGSLDADFGANNLQNYPVLDWVEEWQGMLRVHGHLNSEASSSYRIDFYANAVAHSSGHGEGKHHLGSFEIETNGGGNSVFDSKNEEDFEVMIDPDNPYITATATKIESPETDCDDDELDEDKMNQCLLDKYGDTSEFSLAVQIQE